MSSRLRFSLLGPVRAWHNDVQLELGTPQERLVLAVLLLRRGRTVTTESLIDILWDEEPPPRAVGTIRTYISRLRRALSSAADALVRNAGGYVLRIPPEAVDVERFEELAGAATKVRADGDDASGVRLLREALGLWNGDALAGLPGEFAEGWRVRLAERWITVAELRMDAELAVGNHRDVIHEISSLAAAYPLREKLQAQLMLALYYNGRQAEALDVYARSRAFLAETVHSQPGRELRDAHSRVLAGDPPPPDAHASAAETAAKGPPDQLPADTSPFTGRAGELSRLLDILTTTTHAPVALITGIGGVGKTTLAVHAGHVAADAFPDGRLYVDLHGVDLTSNDPRPADPEEVLRGFLRALGVRSRAIPRGLDECAALYRSTVADRRILVVLDNAGSAAQVRPLLAGVPGCATIVTARSRLHELAATGTFDLGVFTPEEAHELFIGIVGHERVAAEPEAVAEVLEAGGMLPLSIRILGGRLAARPRWQISGLAERLADERNRLAEIAGGDLEVSAAFRSSYEGLLPELRRAFRVLAPYADRHLTVGRAAALLGFGMADAEATCESLTDARVLESPAPGHYRYHDLLRIFAHNRAAEEDSVASQREARARLLDHYLATGKRLLPFLDPLDPLPERLSPTTSEPIAFATAAEGRAWLAAEADGIFAAGRLTATDAEDSDADGELGAALAMVADLAIVLYLASDTATMWNQLADLTTRTIASAVRQKNKAIEGRAHTVLGIVLVSARGSAHGCEQLRAGRQALLEAGDVFHRTKAEYALAGCLVGRDEWAEAVEVCESGVEGAIETGNRSDEISLLGVKARALAYLGRSGEAVSAAERALALTENFGTIGGRANAYYGLGTARFHAGDLEQAISDLRNSQELYRTADHAVWVGHALVREAEVHVRVGAHQEGTKVAAEAVGILSEHGHRHGHRRALTVLGEAALLAGDVTTARDTWQAALDLIGEPDSADAQRLRELLGKT